jgi:hypothetical protein
VIHDEGGLDAATAKLGSNADRWSTWSKLRAVTKATPKASRVAVFIVCWAIAMQDEKREDYSITEYQRYWNENERKAYRVQNEFRELWPEFDNPNEFAQQIVKHLDARTARRDAARLPMTLRVVA